MATLEVMARLEEIAQLDVIGYKAPVIRVVPPPPPFKANEAVKA